jgi:Flp pilus assembly protein TadB
MKFHLVTALLVLGAIVCYFVGFGEGIVPLMAAYLLIEFTLGIRWHRRRRRRREAKS